MKDGLESLWIDGRAVVGPADTLAALNHKRVRWLLIGPIEDVYFWRCPGCGGYGLGQHTACLECSEATYVCIIQTISLIFVWISALIAALICTGSSGHTATISAISVGSS